MQNLQNLLGNGQRQRKAQQERDVQLERERQRVAQLQEAPAPAKPPRPAVMTLEDAPIAHDQPNPRDLYAVEGALKKDFDPVTRQWTEQVIRVQIERKPFAEGAMRAAYRMKIVEGMHVQGKERFFVLKLSKDPHEKTSQYYKDVELQMESRMWASEYNKRGVPKKVDFIPAHVVILTDRPMKPTCTMERFVEGEYVKYNDNWSWCDDKRNTPQAFSHFTWEASGNKLLVCDLQGVGDCWTDPQIHTVDGRGFGKGNAGLQGVRQFMKQHTCNGICRALRLQSMTGRVKQDSVGTQWGAALQKRASRTAAQHKAAAASPGAVAPPALVGVGLSIDGGFADGVLLPLIVVNVKSGSSAAASGLVQRGDFIIQIDDIAVQGASVAACKKLLQGLPGSSVTIHLMRGIKTHSVTLERAAAQHKTTIRANAGKRQAHARVHEILEGHGESDAAGTRDAQQQAAAGSASHVHKKLRTEHKDVRAGPAPRAASRSGCVPPMLHVHAPQDSSDGTRVARNGAGDCTTARANSNKPPQPAGTIGPGAARTGKENVANSGHMTSSVKALEQGNDATLAGKVHQIRPPAVGRVEAGGALDFNALFARPPPAPLPADGRAGSAGASGGGGRGGHAADNYGKMWDKGFLV